MTNTMKKTTSLGLAAILLAGVFAVPALAASDFDDDFLVKQLQQRGPFIVCVDTSGSMGGYPEECAKALFLALLKVAMDEKRGCYLLWARDQRRRRTAATENAGSGKAEP